MRIEDPYFYRDRLTMPKYVVNAGGDQYFPPDSSKFYFDDLVGPKYLRYVPNADHSLRGSDAAGQHPGLLPGRLDQGGDAEVLVGDGRGRLDPREDGGQADAR